jgi:predicted membrane protein
MATTNFRMSFQLFIGLFIIILGLLFTLENLGILYAHDYLKFWPILLVFYGVSRYIRYETMSQRAWGVFWILIGSFMVFDRMELISFSVWDLWPLILVVLGVSLIWGPSRRRIGFPGASSIGDSSATINAFAFMGGFKRSNDSQDFHGGEATAIMGGCEIDLRKASIKDEEAVMNLFSVMGGIEIWVPEDWKVILQGVPILGGFEDKTRPSGADSNKRLIVRGYAIMGGVEIKN